MFKGRHVLINGELRQNSYISKEGNKKTSIYILALEIKKKNKKSAEKNTYTINTANNQMVSDFIEESLEEVF